MALPDRFEQVDFVVGSVILIALPASALVSALDGLTVDPWVARGLWHLPGLVVGVLLAAGRFPVTYHQVWAFSLSSWLLAFAGLAALGLAVPTSNRPLAVFVWVIAVGLGVVVAAVHPVAVVRHRLGHT